MDRSIDNTSVGRGGRKAESYPKTSHFSGRLEPPGTIQLELPPFLSAHKHVLKER